jgi:hypothetical protein
VSQVPPVKALRPSRSGWLRDFRGDTVHASILTLLDEVGLGERFAALPARWRPARACRSGRASIVVQVPA